MSDQLKAWLEKRYAQVTAQYELAETVFEKQRIGPKRRAYREVLQWINDHPQPPPRWTPIEEAGEWDGEMIVDVVSRYSNTVHVRLPSRSLKYVRESLDPHTRVFVIPAPLFNPEDYEVKP